MKVEPLRAHFMGMDEIEAHLASSSSSLLRRSKKLDNGNEWWTERSSWRLA